MISDVHIKYIFRKLYILEREGRMSNSIGEARIIFIKKYRFLTDIVWIDWYEGEKKKLAIISIAKTIGLEEDKEKVREVKVIHPITEFLMELYSSRKYLTMKKHADNLTNFLNFLCKYSGELDIRSMRELQLGHAVSFLNYLGREKRLLKSTVKQYERTLTNFYVFLSQKGVLLNVPKEIFVYKENQWRHGYYLSPFQGVIYPNHSHRRIEHAFPMKYFPLLLEISILEAPRIALGIYLQFFGGIRSGEAVNIRREQFRRRVKSGDFLLNLTEQNFRTDIKDRGGSNVKRVREQQFFNIKDWLEILFQDHIKKYIPLDGSNALFVNNRGNAMTAKSYRNYFNKVKKAFCRYLKCYGNEDDIIVSDYLQTVDWSTHIGRGTFTNLIAEHTDNPFLVAYHRGDASPESALPYIAKTEKLRKKIEQLFSNLNNDYIPRLVDRNKER